MLTSCDGPILVAELAQILQELATADCTSSRNQVMKVRTKRLRVVG